MKPIDRVIEALHARGCEPRRNGSGWSARCPVHADRRPSLSIREANDGRALLLCHAGCRTEAVVQALGLSMADLFDGQRTRRGNGKAETFPTARDAVASLEARYGKRSALYEYRNSADEPVGAVVRWDKPDGSKEIRPVSGHPDGWRIAAMPAPRPLYRLPEILEADPGAPVFVVEGEKACDAAAELGLLATTSAGGSKAAAKADWGPLAGRRVVILPDNDEAGHRYAEDVARILASLDPPARVKIVELPNLPPSGDAYDFIEARDSRTSEEIRAEIETLAESAPEYAPPAESEGPPAVLAPTPFPTEVLPGALRRFIDDQAAALGCDAAMVAVPVLATLAGATGTTRAIELKKSWREFPVVWAAVVARSGTLKSPALDAATAPLIKIDSLLHREHELELEHFEAARLEHEKELAEWRRSKDPTPPPRKPNPPAKKRLVVSDVTVQALAPILKDNPRGVLVARDELAGWILSFNEFKARGRGSDAAAWLELWRGGRLAVDRKGEQLAIIVPRASASVVGTVQPGTLGRLLTPEFFDNGLAARLLLTAPPERPKRWSTAAPAADVLGGYEGVIKRLAALEHVQGEDGPEPVILHLDPGGLEAWANFYNEHARRIHEAADEREAAALAKIEAYAARFALIVALVEAPDARVVPRHAVEAGVTLARWFADETLRVYALMAEDGEDRDRRRLVEWIARRGGTVTPRDLVRGLRRYRGDTEAAAAALDALVTAGMGCWDEPSPGRQGGRPSRVFRLIDAVDVDKTPRHDSAKGGFVDVDTALIQEKQAPEPLPMSDPQGTVWAGPGEALPDAVLLTYAESSRLELAGDGPTRQDGTGR